RARRIPGVRSETYRSPAARADSTGSTGSSASAAAAARRVWGGTKATLPLDAPLPSLHDRCYRCYQVQNTNPASVHYGGECITRLIWAIVIVLFVLWLLGLIGGVGGNL